MGSKSIVVLGGGESGVGAAILAQRAGCDVFLSDAGQLGQARRAELQRRGIALEEGGHTPARILSADEVVKSPGIPETAPIVVALRERGVPVISEIELAGRHIGGAKTICITGSNGKTTTTHLLHQMLLAAGLNVGMVGNVGQSFARQVALAPRDYYVVELSSFQLDGMYDFRADVAVLLNITPDHLDRYDHRLENYAASKLRIAQNQGPADTFIHCADDPVSRATLQGHPLTAGSVRPFTRGGEPSATGSYQRGEALCFVDAQGPWSIPMREIRLQGKHNMYNCQAATLAAQAIGLPRRAIVEGMRSFAGIAHRLELVGERGGVRYVNDSKATNTDAAWYALDSMTTPVVWIAGGVDKGNDYAPLLPLVQGRVHTLICMTTDAEKLHASFAGVVGRIVDAGSAREAVAQAARLAQPGDTVLLSPACASFDLFDNYEQRGELFRKAVEEL
ncbi:MAG: UDP-N-acetylmuramoyl-L-alanine--D-glutamate ligase [Bacteroidia bacterium]|nr:MAG: UDP-N-acetylmuramoyl-L-alanine--D-glutamate ligase [Bacteroidia bacterium]